MLRALTTASLTLITLAACNRASAPQEESSPAGTSSSEAANTAETRQAAGPDAAPMADFPMTLRSEDGSQTTLPGPARRVLAANAGALDLILALGAKGQIAAAVKSILPWSTEMQRGSPLREGQVIPSFEIEQIVSVNPDLIVAHSWQTREKRPLLERLGVPVFELHEAHGWDAVLDDARRLGIALGRQGAADELIKRLEIRRGELARRDRSAVRVLTYLDIGAGGLTAGRDTTYAQMIAWTGARSCAAEAGIQGHAQIDLERLLSLDPDVLVVPAASEDETTSPTLALLLGDSRAKHLRALREGAVVILPAHLFNTTSHHLLEAAEQVALGIDHWLDAHEENPITGTAGR